MGKVLNKYILQPAFQNLLTTVEVLLGPIIRINKMVHVPFYFANTLAVFFPNKLIFRQHPICAIIMHIKDSLGQRTQGWI